jgi:hypothetical protein
VSVMATDKTVIVQANVPTFLMVFSSLPTDIPLFRAV